MAEAHKQAGSEVQVRAGVARVQLHATLARGRRKRHVAAHALSEASGNN